MINISRWFQLLKEEDNNEVESPLTEEGSVGAGQRRRARVCSRWLKAAVCVQLCLSLPLAFLIYRFNTRPQDFTWLNNWHIENFENHA
jgi:hypothetical protein